jgi:hypothetical protein
MIGYKIQFASMMPSIKDREKAFFECEEIELKKLPIMANFGSVTSLPSGSNQAKVSPSNRNRPFFAPESPIFCPIQSFSSIKCLDWDRAQNFTLCKIVFAEI